MIASICRYEGRPEEFLCWLIDCRILDRKGRNGLIVHGWREHNMQLVANWENGKKGGNRRKSLKTNNVNTTHGLTQNENGLTDSIEGLDRIDRLDKKEEKNARGREPLLTRDGKPLDEALARLPISHQEDLKKGGDPEWMQ